MISDFILIVSKNPINGESRQNFLTLLMFNGSVKERSITIPSLKPFHPRSVQKKTLMSTQKDIQIMMNIGLGKKKILGETRVRELNLNPEAPLIYS